MKYISLNVSEEIKHILPDTLEKDLCDNEEICPVCHGLGIVKRDYQFGIDNNENPSKVDWYDNEYFVWCPNCYFGVIKKCEFCDKILPKGRLKCDCEKQQAEDEKERRIKYQETINRAKEISLKDAACYIYDEESDRYFIDESEFAEYYWDLYLENEEENNYDFDIYFERHVPKILWNCSETKMSLDADSIIENACDELHEDARDNIADEKELQDFLDKWCEKQTGTTTYYPCYKEYVRVEKEWFE